ncbi:ankyrin repeat-containing domain protein [Tribonema minus]|uniref:Ankyrin repeat-containing domain protein n=1 Tax=Tribonema minus TaxID=303371 RepID=A0A835Z8I8_9STRA|nr:ankyrin repeat-containing domain protein [Tribonema minus]
MPDAINPHVAAKGGDTALLQLFLDRGGKVNLKDVDAFTPLHFASNFGHSDTCEFLMQHGANVDARSRFRSVPLHFAAEHGRTDIMLLLRGGAGADALNTDRATLTTSR